MDVPDKVSLKPKRTAFAMIPKWVLHAKISSDAKTVYSLLMCTADNDNLDTVRLSDSIAETMDKSKRSVLRYMRELEECGALTITPRYDKRGWQVANRYELEFDDPRGDTSDIPRGDTSVIAGGDTSDMPLNQDSHYQDSPNQDVSEPHDSDAAIEPEIVDEAEETQDRLLTALDDAVEANGFKRPSRTKGNERAMRLLLTKDGYTENQVQWMIGWATDHHFWYKNIRSAEKLRQQFDRLVVEAKEQNGHGPTGGTKPNSAEQRGLDHAGVIERLRQREAQMNGKGAITV